MLLINDGRERHPNHEDAPCFNLPKAERQQIEDQCLSTAGWLNCDQVVTIEEAIHSEDLENNSIA